MYKYVLKRILLLVPILLGVSFIVFSILELTPGDPVDIILSPEASEEAREQLRVELGLNDPFVERYARYIKNAVTGDFGISYRTKRPIAKEVFLRMPVNLKLAFSSMILATIIGIPLGVISAVKQYSALDTVSSVTAMFLAAVPAFWLGLMMIIVFSLKLDLLPSHGVEHWYSYILPSVSLALPTAAQILRLTRSTMLETIRQDYIRTAKAKGASEKTIILNHALKNALLPVITMIGMHFGRLMGGTVVAETVYSISGVGTLVVDAIRAKDIPQVMGPVILISTLFCLVMLVVDILYAFIDPRIKSNYAK